MKIYFIHNKKYEEALLASIFWIDNVFELGIKVGVDTLGLLEA